MKARHFHDLSDQLGHHHLYFDFNFNFLRDFDRHRHLDGFLLDFHDSQWRGRGPRTCCRCNQQRP